MPEKINALLGYLKKIIGLSVDQPRIPLREIRFLDSSDKSRVDALIEATMEDLDADFSF